MYLVWTESSTDFKLYIKATSKRMAFLLFDRAFKKAGVRYDSARERAFAQLVGVPINEKEFQVRFRARAADEDLPLEPDDQEVM